MVSVKYASFLLPVIDGRIHVGQRGTDPHRGAYGPIGGKSDSFAPGGMWQRPQLITKPGGHQEISKTDSFAQSQGRELPYGTAAREFCEEVFKGKRMGEEDITDLFRVGFAVDFDLDLPGVEFECYFHMANVHRRDFSLSARELTEFKPLAALSPEERLYPLAELLLMHLNYIWEEGHHTTFERYAPYDSFDFLSQIPRDLKISQPRQTDMIGAAMYYGACRLHDLNERLSWLIHNRTSVDPAFFELEYCKIQQEIKVRVDAGPEETSL